MQLSLRLSQCLRALRVSLPQPSSYSSRAPLRRLSQLPHHPVRPSPPTCFQRKGRIPVPPATVRYNSNTSTPETPETRPLTDQTSDESKEAQNAEQNRLRREKEPAYQITFTCKPCGERSSHRMSKHGYHRGTVLIRCPSCHNRHVISDNLNIFLDSKKTLEDILQDQGDKVTRGYLEGDMEFWDDGSVTQKSDQEAKSE